MGWPHAQIVDSLDRSNILFDFNPGRESLFGRWISKQEASPLGEPTWTSSVMGIVEDTRTLTMPLSFLTASPEAAIARLSEILTRTAPVYLMWQWQQDSDPLWFRLHRQEAGGALDLTGAYSGMASMRQWVVTLVADAFALGARQTLTPTTGLADAATPVKPPVEITDPIIGDAPAPLNLEIDAGNLAGYASQLMAWAMDPAMSVDPWAGTKTLNTTVHSSDFTVIDVGQLPQTLPPGQYRPLVYLQRTAGSGSCHVQAGLPEDWAPLWHIRTPATTVSPPTGSQDGRWVDCGRFNLPPGADYADLGEDELGDVPWEITFQGDSGGATWKVTNFTVVPMASVMSRAATSTLRVSWPSFPGAGGVTRIDSERARVGLVDATTRKWRMAAPPIVAGGFPVVHPGARNFLLFLPRTSDSVPHDYGTAGETTMWYYPRHLHVGSR